MAQRPGAWRNSPLRSGLPESIRIALDQVARADLHAALEGLAQCADRWGFDHAVRALEEAVVAGRIQTADIVAVGRRQALAPVGTSNVVDLRRYDALLEGRVAR